MPTKNQYYAMIHLGAARLGYTDDADYRAWLESLCGRRSAKDCTLHELASVVATLRLCNALDNPRIKKMRGAVLNDDRPTAAQWGAANSRCVELGMADGCEDARFIAFTNKTCKVSHPRFLTRDAMQKLIAALNNWIANNDKKGIEK
jgi:hypothetical protein